MRHDCREHAARGVVGKVRRGVSAVTLAGWNGTLRMRSEHPPPVVLPAMPCVQYVIGLTGACVYLCCLTAPVGELERRRHVDRRTHASSWEAVHALMRMVAYGTVIEPPSVSMASPTSCRST